MNKLLQIVAIGFFSVLIIMIVSMASYSVYAYTAVNKDPGPLITNYQTANCLGSSVSAKLIGIRIGSSSNNNSACDQRDTTALMAVINLPWQSQFMACNTAAALSRFASADNCLNPNVTMAKLETDLQIKARACGWKKFKKRQWIKRANYKDCMGQPWALVIKI